jgi:hypothetical protein
MNEEQWLTEPSVAQLVDGLRQIASGPATERRLNLFAAACCRRIWELLDDTSRQAVELAELAPGGDAPEALRLANRAVRAAHRLQARQPRPGPEVVAALAVRNAVRRTRLYIQGAIFCSRMAEAWAQGEPTSDEEASRSLRAVDERHIALFRDIIANPFRPVRLRRSWLTANGGTARRLAQAIRTEGAFDRLPILADALEEAACGNAEVLVHCRRPGEHVRHCWVLDLLLGPAA